MKVVLEDLSSGAARWEYEPVEKSDLEFDSATDREESFPHLSTQKLRRKRWIAFVAALIIAVIGSTSYVIYQRAYKPSRPIDSQRIPCRKPSLRMEWRQLDTSQKDAYILAVKCLMRRPSIFQEKTSFYDDFVLVHSQVGRLAHYAAAFLPWHRKYINVYEEALRGHCGYQGTVPYWDWTLDSKDLLASPIWDPVHGFGGNGNVSSPETVVGGLCVTDGPFANSRRAWMEQKESREHEVTFHPHCLSRDFANRTRSAGDVEWLHNLLQPFYVDKLLKVPTYESFFEAFEQGTHNSIPQLLQGDWLTFTAPNDPVFFLHHTQVDRLWWMWQMKDPETRLKQFQGPLEDFRDTTIEHPPASKTDVLSMGGIADDLKIEDVMDTQGEYLCYKY